MRNLAFCRKCDHRIESNEIGAWTDKDGNSHCAKGGNHEPADRDNRDDVERQVDDTQAMIDQLKDWWMMTAEEEVVPVAAKAVEYGPNSMIEVGRAMGRMSGRDLSDEEAIEVACMFYICGKVGRWVDAVAHGKRPSDDTIHDVGVYIKMAQRNRAVGGWPFAPDKPTPGIL